MCGSAIGMSTDTVLHDALDDLFTINAVSSRSKAEDTEEQVAGESIVCLGPSLERYLDKQKQIRRSKTTWNSMDMCFRWQLVHAHFEQHHPGALSSDQVLRSRVQRVTRLSSCTDGSVEYDPVSKSIVKVVVHGVIYAA